MVIVDQILVVGVGVHGLHVPGADPVFVEHRFEHRNYGVGGTGRRGKNTLIGLDLVVVDAVHDVGNVPLARGCEDHFGGSRALQVPTEAGFVAPGTGIVDHDGVVDAISGVVDLRGRVCLDDLDLVAVADQLALFLQHPDGAPEGPVHGVPAQQAGALLEILRAPTLAHHDRPQAQGIAATGLLDQDARDQPPDAAETVQHHVLGLGQGLAHRADVIADHFLEIIARGAAVGVLLIAHGELADIHVRRPQIHLCQRLNHGEGLELGQLVLLDLAHEAVGFHQIGHRPIDHVAAVHVEGDIVFTIELADQRNHGLGKGLPGLPVLEEVLRLRSFHWRVSPQGCAVRKGRTLS